jgi:hypothetical protein
MPVLPLTPAQVTAYNNVATTPPSAPLGDVIEELSAGSGAGAAYGEIRSAADVFVEQENIPEEGVVLDVFSVNGIASGVVVDADSNLIVCPLAGAYELTFVANLVAGIPPTSDLVTYLAFLVDGDAQDFEYAIQQESGLVNPCFTQIVQVAANDGIRVRVRAPDAGDISLRVYNALLRVRRLGA